DSPSLGMTGEGRRCKGTFLTQREQIANRNFPQGLKRLCQNSSFAPLGLRFVPLFTRGSRRGLHSSAATRLNSLPSLQFCECSRVTTRTLTPNIYAAENVFIVVEHKVPRLGLRLASSTRP